MHELCHVMQSLDGVHLLLVSCFWKSAISAVSMSGCGLVNSDRQRFPPSRLPGKLGR